MIQKKNWLIDNKYKYWLIANGKWITEKYPELHNIIPSKWSWGGPVNHHTRCHKKRDDHQIKMLCGWHGWFHSADGIKWEKKNLDGLIKFAESEYDRYKGEINGH